MKPILTLAFTALLFWGCSKESGVNNGGGFAAGGSLARFALVGDNLFVAQPTTVHRFTITPNGITKNGSINVNFQIETIFARDANTLFTGSTTGMGIFNIAGNKLELVDMYPHIFACDPVVANDTLAFVTLNSGFGESANLCRNADNLLLTFDVTNITQIQQIGQKALTKPIGLGLQGDVLFVCNDGIEAFSFADPTNPVSLGRKTIDAVDVIPTPKSLIVTGLYGITQLSYQNGQFTVLSEL